MKLERLQKLAASRNVSTNRDLFTSMDFDTMHICGRRTSQYSLHISMVCWTFYTVNSPFYMVNSTFFMVNSTFFMVDSTFFMVNSTFFMVNSTFYMVN